MITNLLYGKQGLTVEVPDHAVVVEPRSIAGVPDEEQAVLDALRHPIESPPLRDMVKSSDRVAIVISDITRPTPNHKLIPWILKEIPHVPREQITIINGTGTHRDQTREEFVQMLGSWVVDHMRGGMLGRNTVARKLLKNIANGGQPAAIIGYD